ncbi:MAG: META domain-containing protein [Acidimicrobiia bacterium]|nr:META domain-containing protein [Acidimicrobiia bacterium]
MDREEWVKWGVIALAAVGALVLVGAALSSGGDIEGRTWIVESLQADAGATEPIEGTALTATFEDGTVSGVSGCNNFFAGYELDGSSIAIGPAGSTLMFCAEPEGAMEQEQTYLGLLQSADTFDVDGETLTLSANGTTVLTFVEITPDTAAG